MAMHLGIQQDEKLTILDGPIDPIRSGNPCVFKGGPIDVSDDAIAWPFYVLSNSTIYIGENPSLGNKLHNCGGDFPTSVPLIQYSSCCKPHNRQTGESAP
jgi:hypothetical protein